MVRHEVAAGTPCSLLANARLYTLTVQHSLQSNPMLYPYSPTVNSDGNHHLWHHKTAETPYQTAHSHPPFFIDATSAAKVHADSSLNAAIQPTTPISTSPWPCRAAPAAAPAPAPRPPCLRQAPLAQQPGTRAAAGQPPQGAAQPGTGPCHAGQAGRRGRWPAGTCSRGGTSGTGGTVLSVSAETVASDCSNLQHFCLCWHCVG